MESKEPGINTHSATFYFFNNNDRENPDSNEVLSQNVFLLKELHFNEFIMFSYRMFIMEMIQKLYVLIG